MIKYTERLNGVHPDLIKIVEYINEKQLYKGQANISEGVRTLETQQRYVKEGKSKTLNSKHLVQSDGYGHAFDIHPIENGKIGDSEDYDALALVIKTAAIILGVQIEWGGDWKTFVDKPHIQLKAKK